jgi:uncharacterized membrane protein (UPF0127 family)
MRTSIDIRPARGLWQRLKGLIGLREWPAGQALMLRPCNAVHTAFMRFPIDVVFVDGRGRIARIATLRPWRAAACWRARAAYELAAGEAARLGWRAGEVLQELQPMKETS